MLTHRFIPPRLARLLLALAAGALLAAAPARADQWSVRAMPAGVAIGIEIGSPPPPPRYEVMPPPRGGYLWAPGYWAWDGYNYVWLEGRWLRQRPGYIYVPGRWEQRHQHWYFNEGAWQPRHHHHPGPGYGPGPGDWHGGPPPRGHNHR